MGKQSKSTGPGDADRTGQSCGILLVFVRIFVGFTNLFGIVSQVGAGAVPESLSGEEPTKAIEEDADGDPMLPHIMMVVPLTYHPITQGGPNRVC